jgi:homocitrate synthase NifV
LGLAGAVLAFFLQWGIYGLIQNAIVRSGGISLITIITFKSMAGNVFRGNAPLDEVVLATGLTLHRRTGINTTYLTQLCETVAKISGRPIPINKPIVGKTAFMHESGIHCRGLLANRATYELFPPETIGSNAPDFVVGKHSGTTSIQHILNHAGFTVDSSEASLLIPKVRAAASSKKGPLSATELVGIYLQMKQQESIGSHLTM